MYELIKQCYDSGCYQKTDLNIFVNVGWITTEQMNEIISEK